MLSRRSASTETWVFLQMGTACASKLRPLGVSVITRLRRSSGSTVIFSRRRRCNGLRAAVNVVRSIPSSFATPAMSGGSARFRDIISENCPFVSPTGRRASSKRRASALAARCTCMQKHASRTRRVVLNVGFAAVRIQIIILISTCLAKRNAIMYVDINLISQNSLLIGDTLCRVKGLA